MSRTLKNNLLVAALLVVFVLTIGLTCLFAAPNATALAEEQGKVKVCHISDIHVYVEEYCNKLSGGYIRTYSTDTKLLEESESCLDGAIKVIKNELPDYVVVTGDITSNSELAGHQAVADAFTELTYWMRSAAGGNKAAFQIYVIPGNHDLYNKRSASYMVDDEELDNWLNTTVSGWSGEGLDSDSIDALMEQYLSSYRKTAPNCTYEDFFKIYEDFGMTGWDYEGTTATEATAYTNKFYSDNTAKYGEFYSFYGSAEKVYLGTINWQDTEFFKDSQYFYTTDSNGAAITTLAEKITAEAPTASEIAAYEATDNYTELDRAQRAGCLSYAAFPTDDIAFLGFDNFRMVYDGDEKAIQKLYDDYYKDFLTYDQYASSGRIGWNQRTGGDINTRQLLWALDSVAPLTTAGGKTDKIANGNQVFTLGHMNYLPHFDMEDEILIGFTLDNWEYISTVLADKGIKYAFSGHMHSNDIEQFITQNGNVFYDIETGSTISYGAPVRFVDVSHGTDNGGYYEKMVSNVKSVCDVSQSLTYTIKSAVINSVSGGVYNDAYLNGGFSTELEDVPGSNSGNDLQTILTNKLNGMVSGLLNSYLDESYLKNTLLNVVNNLNLGDESINRLLAKLVNDLFALDFSSLREGLTAKGYTLEADEDGVYTIIELAGDMVYGFLNGDGTCGLAAKAGIAPVSLADAAIHIYKGHCSGANEVKLSGAYALILQAANEGLLTQKLVDTLLDYLLPAFDLLTSAPVRLDGTEPALEAGVGLDIGAQVAAIEGTGVIGAVIKPAITMLKNGGVDSLLSLVEYIPNLLNNAIIGSAVNGFVQGTSFESLISTALDYIAKLSDYDTLSDFLNEELIDKYVTKALIFNLGQYVGKIITSFGEDKSPDGASFDANDNVTNQSNFVIRYVTSWNADCTAATYAFGDYCYYSKSGTESGIEYKSAENGNLPGMVSIAPNGESSLTFSWFTAINASVYDYAQYDENDNVLAVGNYTKAEDAPAIVGKFQIGTTANFSDATIINVDGENVLREIPGIDLGITYITHYNMVYNRFVTTYAVEAGKTYYYRFGNSYGWSKIGSYTTPGATDGFTVLGITDIQGSVEANYQLSYDTLTAALNTVGKPAFILTGGDNTDKGTSTVQWEWLLNGQTDVWYNNPVAATTGNHEDSDYALSSVLALPESAVVEDSGSYYSFYYKNVCFVVINSNDLTSDSTLGTAQTAWLNGVLQSAKTKKDNGNIDWIVVTMHKGPYTAGSHAFDTDVIALRAQLTPLFSQYGVDLCLEGHDHCYSVSQFISDIDNGEVTAATPDYDAIGNVTNANGGVLYINMGCAGDKFYNYIYSDEVALKDRAGDVSYFKSAGLGKYVTEDNMLELTETPAFTGLNFTDGKMSVVTYTVVDGKVIVLDQINFTKTASETAAPAFSVTVKGADGKLTIDNETVKDMELCAFVGENTDGLKTYYLGYSLAAIMAQNKIGVKDYDSVKSGSAETACLDGMFIALFSKTDVNADYASLGEAKAVAYTDGVVTESTLGKTITIVGGLPAWAIALIVIGCAAVVAAAAYAAIVIVKKKKAAANK